ncbi:hypothetical protein PSACC_01121 [Paramicrosporidium saccamoebae]|uniref:Uncharacterized protein n=1 Tax=Paramicrosporidium saccamoebae TaxID=1246581 RepID=A0A2H9TMT3_9FUNG|nr:hypothetical protein PSACC_01121 [Paramicrosporidium saccamoebae]
MDPQDATRRFEEGAFVLMMGVPLNFEVGIDGVSWTVGPLFKGIKMIPPGLHFVYYQCGGNGALTGFFRFFKPKEILYFQWDIATEQLRPMGEPEFSIYELDRFLGPFPWERMEMQRFQDWTNLLNLQTLNRIVPGGTITPMATSYHSSHETIDLHFTKIPTEREIRPTGLDRTPVIRTLSIRPMDLLAELQLCFVLLVLGHNFEGFEQWRAIVALLCQCSALIKEDPPLYMEFLNILQGQLQECPDDFFECTGIAGDNRLFQWFQALCQDCMDTAVLQAHASAFSAFIMSKFGWDLTTDADSGEYAPIIVDP